MCSTRHAISVFGYQGKQVRDNIHSYDLINAFWHFYLDPRVGEVYNIGGSRHSNCSMLEAIALCEEIAGKRLDWSCEQNRKGDPHLVDQRCSQVRAHYPGWRYRFTLRERWSNCFESYLARTQNSRYTRMLLSVVIPARNEAGCVAATVTTLTTRCTMQNPARDFDR